MKSHAIALALLVSALYVWAPAPSPADASDGDAAELEAFFADKLTHEYRHLWLDTPSEPFSFAEASDLYVMDDRLTALDTDALLVPGQDSRLEGWQEYAGVWPQAYEHIRSFVPGPIRELNVRRHGSWALTNFDMAGEAELASGQQLAIFKHVTLLWIREGSQWRILHEHLSDSTAPEALEARP
ncbi:MAG: nuclear transport factor 2 family protein [Myxococcota bacterium]